MANNLIVCPNCGSTSAKTKGMRNGKNRFICKDCGRYYTVDLGAAHDAGVRAEVEQPVEVNVAADPAPEPKVSKFPAPEVKAQRTVEIGGQVMDIEATEKEVFLMAQKIGEVVMDEERGVYVVKPNVATKG